MVINKNYDLKEIVYLCEQDNVWKTEIFKDIKDHEGCYQISDLGRVRGLERRVKNKYGYRKVNSIIKKQAKLKDGYFYVKINNKQYSIHSLVAIAFLNHKRCKFEIVVDHKNNLKTDNRLLNLQLVTNRVNSTKDNKNKTGFIGVTTQGRLFKSTIRDNGVSVYLGMFKTAELAHEAYKKRRKEIESRA